MKDLVSKVAVVTGGAGGIGKEIVQRFCREGMKVVVADVETPVLEATVKELEAQSFDVLGVEPRLGRTFRPDDDDLGAEAVLLLSHEYWQRSFGANPEIVAFWKDVNEVRAAARRQENEVRDDLDGQKVMIPGYMLPLDLDGQAVREFLLVPYVGACIHTPPPPRNQIVFVTSADGMQSKGLFEPVWVEGTLRTDGGQHELFMVDGRSKVNTGYSMQAKAIKPYED